jgi:hypothetical protein
MAFRATSITTQRAYQQVKGAAANVRANCAGFISRLAGGNADYVLLRDIYVLLHNASAQLTSLAATPGLAAYASDQEGDPEYDVVAEFTALQATLAAALSWMGSNVPTNVTAVSPANWPSSEGLIATTFTPAQTAGLRTQLAAVVAAIS